MTRTKYGSEERRKVYGRILELAAAGVNSIGILKKMQTEGFKEPDGAKPINSQTVGQVLARARAGELHQRYFPQGTRGDFLSRPQAAASKKIAPALLPPTALGVLTDPHLSDAQKVRMLTAYCNL